MIDKTYESIRNFICYDGRELFKGFRRVRLGEGGSKKEQCSKGEAPAAVEEGRRGRE